MPKEILQNLISPPGETDLTKAFNDLGKMLSENVLPEIGVVKQPKDFLPAVPVIVPPELAEHMGK